MYGDRVSVTIDSHGVIGGGPNAMDTPLSYVSPMITEELILERGIPGVASAPESIGGHIDTRLARGDFEAGSAFGVNGSFGTRYAGNGNSSTTAGRFTTANSKHKFSLVGAVDRADDLGTPEGDILPSGLSRNRGDLSYEYSGDNTGFLVYGGLLETTDAGTPALAMDIRTIDTQMFGTQVSTGLADNVNLDVHLAYNDVEHLMDNFSLRPAPASPMMYRQNFATGSGLTFDIGSTFGIGDYGLRIGIDGVHADHDSVITNPENAMFRILNFSNVQRDVTGLYAVWQNESDLNGW
jgi:iron complex outermembrane receptor protein